MPYWGFFKPYVSVANRKSQAMKKLKKLMEKNKNIKPIVIEGKSIANTWWGKSWNKNLESYADFSNRIGRGRSYVRNSAVLDLQIEPGLVKSLVQGSYSDPYEITITIKSLDDKTWNEIKTNTQGKLETLNDLLNGKFPKTLSEVFTNQETGLFPKSTEIEFNCSCPDSAYMCKHIAATLYGIGARLDKEPSLFFTLRNIEMKDLIGKAIEDKKDKLLEKAKQKSKRVIEDSDLSSLFGIEVDSGKAKEEKSASLNKMADSSLIAEKKASKEKVGDAIDKDVVVKGKTTKKTKKCKKKKNKAKAKSVKKNKEKKTW